MDIKKLSDEQLAIILYTEEGQLLGKWGTDNWHVSHYIKKAKFLRQCVKDSVPSEEQIYAMLDELEKNQAFTFGMIQSDKDELVGAIRKLMEPK